MTTKAFKIDFIELNEPIDERKHNSDNDQNERYMHDRWKIGKHDDLPNFALMVLENTGGFHRQLT